MPILPETSGYNIYQAEPKEYPTETFLVNKEAGTIERIGGGLEAMRQAVEIILNIERYRYQIYSSNFGRELNRLIGRPPDYVASMLKRRIKEAFSMDSRILSVDEFEVQERGMGTITCAFVVRTVFGNIKEEVEV